MRTLVLGVLILASACSTSDRSDGYSYENNAFYSGQVTAPMRGRGPQNVSGESFFNKVCTSNGSSGHGGSQYDCHYEGE